MAKITRAHIIAARGRKRILEGQKKAVPPKIVKLAALDPAKFPREASVKESSGRHLPLGVLDHDLESSMDGASIKVKIGYPTAEQTPRPRLR